MITEKDLLEAIAECQGERNPNANTCIKLAAYYTILNEIKKDDEPYIQSYSYEPDDRIQYESGTEFAQVVNGHKADEVMAVMDELMTALKVINPRMYAGVLRKFEG